MIAERGAPLPLIKFENLACIPRVVHGVTTRAGGVSSGVYGSLNLSLSVGDAPEAVTENRRLVAERFDRSPQAMVTTRQVHGADTVIVDQAVHAFEDSPRGDALASDRDDVLLMQRCADCVPILLASTRKSAVAVAHAGWRGTLAGVASSTVACLETRWGIRPADIMAAIGPSIGPCCFEVGPEVAREFQAHSLDVVEHREPRPHVSLWEANRQMLLRAGVPAESIEVTTLCTRCRSSEFFSHRAMGYPAGRFAAVIGLQS